ncbi:hypothetical protein G4B88_021169 [Cannabis sativa]|uniref:RNase H type-1 domain-containing protein n=1 Tax=Cannabis sativa TaxID=3483 RepID=A0A7J6HY96_CANSA|nr:hypothetical protein G4B88_021169 [Cannabis sativa]
MIWASWVVGVEGGFSVAAAKLLKVKMGLQWALSLGFSLSRVECDSKVVASWVNNPKGKLRFIARYQDNFDALPLNGQDPYMPFISTNTYAFSQGTESKFDPQFT